MNCLGPLVSRAAVAGLLAFTVLTGCASTPTGTKELSREDRARLYIEIAGGALAEGDPTGALASLLKAEAEDDSMPEIYHGKALVFLAKGDAAESLLNARKAVKMAPTYSDANNTLGKLLLDQGRSEEAIPYLAKAANDPLYRDAFKPLTNLGILHYRLGRYATAQEYFDRAVRSSPQGACIALYYRGNVHMKNSKVNDAIRDYEQATKRACANYPDAHLALGIAYQSSKQYALARKKYLEIENRYPGTKVAEQAVAQLRYLP